MTGICRNKSSLATIFANPIYRGIKLFNREARVEGEHGRRRRRNAEDAVVSAEVKAIVPEQHWTRVAQRAKDRGPDLDRAHQRLAGLERQDANLRRVLRTAAPRVAERIVAEMEDVATDLAIAAAQVEDLSRAEESVRVTEKVVQQTLDEMNGILEHAALDTRVAWVRDLFDRIDVDSGAGEAAARVAHRGRRDRRC